MSLGLTPVCLHNAPLTAACAQCDTEIALDWPQPVSGGSRLLRERLRFMEGAPASPRQRETLAALAKGVVFKLWRGKR